MIMTNDHKLLFNLFRFRYHVRCTFTHFRHRYRANMFSLYYHLGIIFFVLSGSATEPSSQFKLDQGWTDSRV